MSEDVVRVMIPKARPIELADAFRVENVTWVEVPDAQGAEAVGSTE